MTKADQTPKVSVLMPVYNAERYLKQAVDSILDQTFTDFELIAINDGSTDKSGEILDYYKGIDDRVIVVQRENKGLVATLNEAIELAKGEYLARQDSDDISFSTRLEKQVAVLDADNEMVLVTGAFEVFDEQDEFLYREVLPADDEDIKRAMYLRNPIGHGSVMFRKSVCINAGMYSDECGPTEDFELWTRLARKGKFTALEAAMFHWRVNTLGITTTNNSLQRTLMKDHLENLWQLGKPRVIGSRELRLKGAHYRSVYQDRGVAMKENMLADNAQLAVKMIRRKHVLDGMHQLFSVALVGRSGTKTVLRRLSLIRKGSAEAVKRRLLPATQDTDVV
jgi:glycosyltransferase involved in cell wall biosynthesis